MLKGPNSEHLVSRLGTDILTSPPYRPDLKGAIEAIFHRLNTECFRLLPGNVTGKRKRGDRDPRLESALTIHDIRRTILRYVLDFNKWEHLKGYPMSREMLSARVKAHPLSIWNWAIEHYGCLRPADPVMDRLNLLPGATAPITEYGVMFEGLYYVSERAVQEGWFEAARAPKRGRAKTAYVSIAYDPRDVSQIYLRYEGVQQLEPLVLAPRSKGYLGRDLWEVRAEMKRRADEMKADEHQRRQEKISVQASTQQDVEAATRRAKQLTGGKPKSQRTKNVKAATAVEKRHLHRDGARNFLPMADPPEPEPQVQTRPQISAKAHGYEAYYRLFGGNEDADARAES